MNLRTNFLEDFSVEIKYLKAANERICCVKSLALYVMPGTRYLIVSLINTHENGSCETQILNSLEYR